LLEHAFDTSLIPTFGKLGAFAHRFLRLRRRYAKRGLPARSYAVITKTPPVSAT
jgi:hypothetical protein